MKYLFTVASIAAAISASGCVKGSIPPNVPTDVQAELSCVAGELLAGDFDPFTIAKACTKGELAIAVDLLSWLLSTSIGAQLPPAAAKTIQDKLVAYRLAHPPVVSAGH